MAWSGLSRRGTNRCSRPFGPQSLKSMPGLPARGGARIRGVRVIRMPDGNHFRGELTDEIAPVRNADGEIDLQATTQAIANVVESWVREHPEQWLWLHRRWR